MGKKANVIAPILLVGFLTSIGFEPEFAAGFTFFVGKIKEVEEPNLIP